MSKHWRDRDPQAKTEADKYERPVPSREFIADFLRKWGAPISHQHLCDELRLKHPDEIEAVRRRLIAMCREADPTHLTSESLLALFLAAAHQGENDLSERWGQEIKRRNPQAEAVRWVDQLAKSRKSAS